MASEDKVSSAELKVYCPGTVAEGSGTRVKARVGHITNAEASIMKGSGIRQSESHSTYTGGFHTENFGFL